MTLPITQTLFWIDNIVLILNASSIVEGPAAQATVFEALKGGVSDCLEEIWKQLQETPLEEDAQKLKGYWDSVKETIAAPAPEDASAFSDLEKLKEKIQGISGALFLLSQGLSEPAAP